MCSAARILPILTFLHLFIRNKHHLGIYRRNDSLAANVGCNSELRRYHLQGGQNVAGSGMAAALFKHLGWGKTQRAPTPPHAMLARPAVFALLPLVTSINPCSTLNCTIKYNRCNTTNNERNTPKKHNIKHKKARCNYGKIYYKFRKSNSTRIRN